MEVLHFETWTRFSAVKLAHRRMEIELLRRRHVGGDVNMSVEHSFLCRHNGEALQTDQCKTGFSLLG